MNFEQSELLKFSKYEGMKVGEKHDQQGNPVKSKRSILESLKLKLDSSLCDAGDVVAPRKQMNQNIINAPIIKPHKLMADSLDLLRLPSAAIKI